MQNIAWLEGEDITKINYSFLKNTAVLEGPFLGKATAVAERPKNLFYYSNKTDLYFLGAAYLEAIAVAHIFPDANKRTAMFGCIAFLQRNRIYIDNNSNILSSLALGSAKHEISLEEIGKTLEKLSLNLKKELEKNNETTFKR